MDDPTAYKKEMLGSDYDFLTSINEPYKVNIASGPEPNVGINKKTKKTSRRHPSLGPGETNWKGEPTGGTEVSDSQALAMSIPGVDEGDIENIKFWQDESDIQKQRVNKLSNEENILAQQNQENALIQQNNLRNEQINQAMNQQQWLGTNTLDNQAVEGGRSKRGFSNLRTKIAGSIGKLRNMIGLETGGYLEPSRRPFPYQNALQYNMGGELAKNNQQQNQMNEQLLETQQNTQGEITDDTIRHTRMRKFIAELNAQSPLFIDTILTR